MAKVQSAPVSIRIQKSGTSALAKLAASMPIGSWAPLNVINQNAALGVGPTSGSMIHYCNSMPWNPVRKCIEIVAMDHAAGAQRYVRFDETSNSFIVVRADDGMGTATRHGYDHNVVNPFTGDLYHRSAQTHSDSPTIDVYKWAINGDSAGFSKLPGVAPLHYQQIALASCWWSGSFVGAGNQGCLLIFNSGDSALGGSAQDGGLYAYNPLTNTWFWTLRGASPNYGTGGSSYHSVFEYSVKKNVAVYGGGNDNPRKLWRLNADRSFVAMPDTPGTSTVGMQQGVICEDPVTGNFILLSNGQLWELNPSGAGTWTQQSGARTPPASVGNPTFPHGVTCTAISDYGVIAYITQTGVTGGTFYLYKHA